MSRISQEEREILDKILKEQDTLEVEHKNHRKKLKFGKKILASSVGIAISLIIFSMVMIYQGKDTSTLAILATAGVGVIPFMYNIYDKNNTQINLKHMEKNYIEDYDEKNNLY